MTALRVLDLFSGIGGFSLGLERTGGFKTVAFCEIEPFCRRVLAKHWPEVPCYDDVRTLTATRLVADGIGVDVVCGGFPCQDISEANTNGRGIDGDRSGLWFEYARLVGELRPHLVVVENVRHLLTRGIDRVFGTLATLGYDAEWHCVPASYVGAPHRRDRVWIAAYPNGERLPRSQQYHGVLERAFTSRPQPCDSFVDARSVLAGGGDCLRNRDGVSVTMERRRLSMCGNAVVPQIPELIGRAILASRQEAA